MAKGMNWAAANQRKKMADPSRWAQGRQGGGTIRRIVPIPAGFWEAWHRDREAMKVAGYFVRRAGNSWQLYQRLP